MISLPTSEIILRLSLAAVLGSLVGLERQRHERGAGLRTHMLVCVGSALVMIVSAFGFEDVIDKPGVTLDPSRLAAQVVSGIGFLGAGTIMFLKQKVVRGLTTAAGLWGVAAVGLAVGGGLYLAATIAILIFLTVLFIFKYLEQYLFRSKKPYPIIHLTFDGKLQSVVELEALLKQQGIAIRSLTILPSEDNSIGDDISLVLGEDTSKKQLKTIENQIYSLQGIKTVDIEHPSNA